MPTNPNGQTIGNIDTPLLCDFITSRKAGLDIHLSKKHKEIEQVDGSTSDTEENYAEAYWERDELSSTYQRYLDVIEDIQSSNLTTQEREIEIERAKSCRLEALLKYGFTLQDLERSEIPPWY